MRRLALHGCPLALASLLVADDARAADSKRRFSTISVVEATYGGGNCPSVSKGNVTQALAAACNNQKLCNFRIHYREVGEDPAPGCDKAFAVSYRCSGGSRFDRCSVEAEAGAGGEAGLPNNFCLLHCPQNR